MTNREEMRMTPQQLAEKIAHQTDDWISLGYDEFLAFTIPAIREYENALLERVAVELGSTSAADVVRAFKHRDEGVKQ